MLKQLKQLFNAARWTRNCGKRKLPRHMSINKFLVTLFLALIVLLAALFGSLTLLSNTQQEIAASEHRRYTSFKLADELRQSSDDLTKMARLYVITANERFAGHFQEILDIRHGEQPRPAEYDFIYWDLVLDDEQRPRPYDRTAALEDLMIEQGFSLQEFSKLEHAEEASDDLLLNVLPSVIAKRLKEGETTIADEFPEVSVMFVDMVGALERHLRIRVAR
jgi:hypothetical protein